MQDELQGKTVERITFKEVTQKAVEKALESPRQIDNHLVDAYKARRALDYLVGYNISPILWQKVGAARSAGTTHTVNSAESIDRGLLASVSNTPEAAANDATPAL